MFTVSKCIHSHVLCAVTGTACLLGGIAFAAGGAGAADRQGDPEIGTWGLDRDAQNPSVKPGDDFFRFANGVWLDSYEIPEDLGGYSSFTKLFLRSEERIREIIEEAAESEAPRGSVAQKVGTLYREFLDEATIEKTGLTPLDPYLREIRVAESHDQVADLLARFDRVDGGGWGGGGTTPFAFYVDQDAKDPSSYIPTFLQSGLGLPDRDYYLEADNPRFAEALKAYRECLVTFFNILGESHAEDRAEGIITLETRLAEVHWPTEETRDVDKTYNKLTRRELKELAPGFPWEAYLEAAGFQGQDEFIISTPSAYTGMARIYAETKVEVWKDFMMVRLLRNNAAFLPREVDDTQFTFVSTALSGAKTQRERWKRGVQTVNGSMGDAVGQLYVERYFPPTAKSRIDELVNNLLVAMGQRIDGLEWMSEATKEAARDKLSRFTVKIGYPDEFRDYSGLEVQEDDLLGNAFRARAFQYDYNMAKLGGPVDRGEWFLSPQTVNAYYNPGMNEIVFPAGILEPPFFDPHADDAVNYGAIGAVIGHEIGHGFDDQGRKSDGDGVLRDWWTPEDVARFKERTDRLVAQYNEYSPIEGMTINGEFTLGENIGDLGGLEIAYHAYKLSLHGQEAPVIDGLTGDQRFFLGFAQMWRGKMRDAILTQQLSSDPHSPVEFRVNGALPNIDAWYAAFNVQPGDKMYLAPDRRVRIW